MSRPREEPDAVRVLGVDPGSRATGYAVVDDDGDPATLLDLGVIRTSSDASLAVRLRQIHDVLREVVDEHDPDEAAVEEVFFAANVRSALILGHARGAALLAVGDGIEVYEYSARKVKKAVVGYGQADKKQVVHMMKTLFHLQEEPPEDAADALALALCHLQSRRFLDRVEEAEGAAR